MISVLGHCSGEQPEPLSAAREGKSSMGVPCCS